MKNSNEEIKLYDDKVEDYINTGINYGANTIRKADRDDLEQLASDSFFYGWEAAKEFFKNQKNQL